MAWYDNEQGLHRVYQLAVRCVEQLAHWDFLEAVFPAKKSNVTDDILDFFLVQYRDLCISMWVIVIVNFFSGLFNIYLSGLVYWQLYSIYGLDFRPLTMSG